MRHVLTIFDCFCSCQERKNGIPAVLHILPYFPHFLLGQIMFVLLAFTTVKYHWVTQQLRKVILSNYQFHRFQFLFSVNFIRKIMISQFLLFFRSFLSLEKKRLSTTIFIFKKKDQFMTLFFLTYNERKKEIRSEQEIVHSLAGCLTLIRRSKNCQTFFYHYNHFFNDGNGNVIAPHFTFRNICK